MSLLIDGAAIITIDPERRILDPGAVYVDGTRIMDVGLSDEVRRRHPRADRVVNGWRKLIVPGLISAHTHVGYTVFRGRAEDAGVGCVTKQYLPMNSILHRKERLAVGALTYAELLRSGVTTVLEMEEDADVYAPFVERLGIRSAMGVMIHDVDVESFRRGHYRFDRDLGERQLAQAVTFAEQWHGRANGRITAIMAPNMVVTSSPMQLRAIREVADRLGLRLSTHLGWGPTEVAATMELFGRRPVRHAVEEGFLQGDVVAAHCHAVDDDDLDLLARAGAAVAHCPLMNAVRGVVAPVRALRQRGVTVSLGSDNMFGDFLDVVRACVLVARIRDHDASTMPSMEALELATRGGARALGMDDKIGSIEIGKQADLVMLDCRAFGLTPTLEPVANLVYHGHARDVEMVLVDGAVVVEGGQVRATDARLLVDEAQQAALSGWERFVTKYGGIVAG